MISFDTDPDRYNHWKLGFDGPVATLTLDVAEDKPLAPGYKLTVRQTPTLGPKQGLPVRVRAAGWAMAPWRSSPS